MDDILFNVSSDAGQLKKVLMHTPGREIESIVPEFMDELLFEDIPYLEGLREEHGCFCSLLESAGVEVVYHHELLAQTLEKDEYREVFIEQLLEHGTAESRGELIELKSWLMNMSPEQISETAAAGLRSDLPEFSGLRTGLGKLAKEEYPFFISPLPNLYFTRDPGTVINDGISFNTMRMSSRQREAWLLEFIFRHHPLYASAEFPVWHHSSGKNCIEGGDIIVINKNTLLIGLSARTSVRAIESIAAVLFSDNQIKKIVVVQIPFIRSYMHLDTVLTMVDYDKFITYHGIQGKIKVFTLYPASDNNIRAEQNKSLKSALEKALGGSAVDIIEAMKDDPVSAAREQWNDSINTLAVAPGKVVTYNRNTESNKILRQHGIEVLEIDGSELVRGRGGPRCMTMPLIRE